MDALARLTPHTPDSPPRRPIPEGQPRKTSSFPRRRPLGAIPRQGRGISKCSKAERDIAQCHDHLFELFEAGVPCVPQ